MATAQQEAKKKRDRARIQTPVQHEARKKRDRERVARKRKALKEKTESETNDMEVNCRILGATA